MNFLHKAFSNSSSTMVAVLFGVVRSNKCLSGVFHGWGGGPGKGELHGEDMEEVEEGFGT